MSNGARRALTHSSIYAIGNIARQLAGFIMLPIYTRHLSPSDYGVVGLLTAALALIEIFFGARLAQSIPKFYYEETDSHRKKSVVSTAFIITACASLFTLAILISIRDSSSLLLFRSTDYSSVIGLFSVLIVTQALEFYAMTFIRIQQRPWLFISISLMKLVLQLTLNIWLVVYEDMGVLGVATAAAVSSTIFGVGLSVYTLAKTGVIFSADQAIRMLRFNWPLWLGGLAGLYMGSSNRYFINIFSTTADVGLFELAAKFSAILALLVWDPFQQYWSAERFKIYQSPNATAAYKSAFLTVSCLLAIGSLGIALFAAPLIRIMAAPVFHGASQAVPFLTFAVMFSCLTLFSNFSFLIKEKTFWITRNNYITAGVITLLFFALVPRYGFLGAALAGLIAAAFQFWLVHRAGRRVYDMEIPLKPLAQQLAITTGILIAATWVSAENIVVDIALKSGLFLMGCAGVIVISLRQPEMRENIINLLPQQLKNRFIKKPA